MMRADPCLTGYAYSVYTRAVKMALHLKQVSFTERECDPFDAEAQADLRRLHPFGRVPVLECDGVRLYETQAILDYIDLRFEGPSLTPTTPLARARMRQVMSIVDQYVYWPMVRQVVSQALFQPLWGKEPDHDALSGGLAAAPLALQALEQIAQEGLVLGEAPGLAECLLWPMLDYFKDVEQGGALLAAYPGLLAWCARMTAHPSARKTRPDLARLKAELQR